MEQLLADPPRWLVMWLIAFAVFASLKLTTWMNLPPTGAPLWKHLGYLFAWPGMNAPRFFGPPETISPSTFEWFAAFTKTLFGLVIIWALTRWLPEEPVELRGWTLMVGLAFTLHFGLFHILSCFWRSRGVAAEPLMRSPAAASSIGDFWSRRWNVAFRDLTHQYVLRPFAPKIGLFPAFWLGFFISGVIHDVVISLPAGGGFGLPTLFFLIQAAGAIAERSKFGKRIGLGRGTFGWTFSMLLLVLPAPLLFHRPFLQTIVIPFATAIGAI